MPPRTKNRTRHIRVSLSQEEMAVLRQRAQRTSLSMSDFVRGSLFLQGWHREPSELAQEALAVAMRMMDCCVDDDWDEWEALNELLWDLMAKIKPRVDTAAASAYGSDKKE